MPDNQMIQVIREGRIAVGTYVTQSAWDIMPALARAGMSFVRIGAHLELDETALRRTIEAAQEAGLAPTVRVGSRADDIAKAVELGAQSISVPDVQSAEEAAKIVKAVRSAETDRLIWPPKISDAPARGVIVSVQMESVEALAQIEEIASIDGVHMVQSGRLDLAQSMGFNGQAFHPKVLEAEDRIFSTARRHGKWVSLHLPAGVTQRELSGPDWSAQVVTLGSDVTYLIDGLRNHHSAVFGKPGATGTPGGKT